VRRLLLVRHAPTSATRAASFPGDEPLDRRGRSQAASLAALLPGHHELLCSPSSRCRETARAAGLAEPLVQPELAECDFGTWTGRTLAELDESDPEAVAAWMTDADACPHGGESLTAFAMRVGLWLDGQAALDGNAVAITHGGVVKAALVHALDAPIAAFWRLDVSPLAITELHAHDGRWTVTRMNVLAAKDRPARHSRHDRSGEDAAAAEDARAGGEARS
jgi:broad specificity phosphatase PhoE